MATCLALCSRWCTNRGSTTHIEQNMRAIRTRPFEGIAGGYAEEMMLTLPGAAYCKAHAQLGMMPSQLRLMLARRQTENTDCTSKLSLAKQATAKLPSARAAAKPYGSRYQR